MGLQADRALDLLLHSVRIGSRQVDLVQDRDDLQIVLHRQIGVGHGLGLDALGGVDDQQRTLASRQAPRNLVREVHVARRVD